MSAAASPHNKIIVCSQSNTSIRTFELRLKMDRDQASKLQITIVAHDSTKRMMPMSLSSPMTTVKTHNHFPPAGPSHRSLLLFPS